MLLRNISIATLLVAGGLAAGPAAWAGSIYTLDGSTVGGVTPAEGTYQDYQFTYTATGTVTNLSFTFRNDSGYTGLDDVSVTPLAGGANLVLNGGFELGGSYADALGGTLPTDWAAIAQNGVTPGGYLNGPVSPDVTPLSSHSGSYNWADGTSDGFDGISQSFATTAGAQYTLSFWASSFPGFNASTDETVVYVGGSVPGGFSVIAGTTPASDTTPVPEPAAFWLLGAGLAGLAMLRRRA